MECTIDNAFNFNLVLQKLFKIIVVYYIKKLKIKIQIRYFIQKALKTVKVKLTGGYGGIQWLGSCRTSTYFNNVKFFLLALETLLTPFTVCLMCLKTA